MGRFWNPRKAALQAGAAPRALFDDAVMMLEERVMLDATPAVTVDAPTNVFLKNPGATFTATILFDNTGTDPGYGPFVELIVPQNGADGAGVPLTNNDGITFNSATYLGQAVTSFTATIAANGDVTNQLTGETVNVGAANAGQQFVVLQLPFGSFTGPQTPTAITANFTLSPNADLGTGLVISGRGGFQFGATPLATDDPIIRQVGFGTDTVVPNLVAITKTSTVPNDKEAEVATGPNQPFFYTITVDIADGQTLTNLVVTDILPSTFFYQGLDSVTVGGVASGFTTGGIAPNTLVGTGGQNTLTVTVPTVTAPANSTTDVVITFHGYVNDVRADASSVINPTTGAITNTDNNVQATYRWTPLDPLDQPGPPNNFVTFNDNPAGPENTLQNQPIVIQKTGVITTNTGPATLNPGDTIEYTLNIQVSDYFSVGDLSLSDVLGDGQRLDTSFLPTIALVQRGVTSATVALPGTSAAGGEFTGTFASAFSAATGLTTSTIALSTALTTGGTPLDADGVLAGGRTQAGDAGANTGGTRVQIKFRVIVQNAFENDALLATNRAVDQGDQVGNNVTISGSIRNNATPATILDPIALRDDGDAFLDINKGTLAKTIYAINGNTNLAGFMVGGNLQLKAGDRITYRLQYQLPITSFQDFTITDFLPLPVLRSDANPIVFNAGAPAFTAGELVFGPGDTFAALTNSPDPTTSISASTAGNSITIAFANYSLQAQNLPNQASTIVLLLTVQAQDTQFANGLFLTNLATSSESNTTSNATQDNSIIKIQLAQPNLLIQKAYVTTTKGTIGTPTLAVTGVTFGAPNTATSFTGTITDTNLGTTATIAAPNLNSNLSGVDAGDFARVAIVINNEGRSNAFDTVFTDTLAAGTTFLGGSAATANLVVKTGSGAVLAAGVDYTLVANATGFTITLIDTPTVGKVGADATNGSDIIVVTYDIALANTVTIAPTTAPLTSSATITKFTATDGSAILQPVNAAGQTDPATITLQQPTVVKAVVAASSTVASTTEPNLTIGEQQSYTVTYTLPEGTTPLLRLIDIVPNTAANGTYEIVSATVTSIGANLRQGDGVTAINNAYIGAAVISVSNTTATFGGAGFTVVNASDNVNNSGADQIVVTYVVRAINSANNTQGDTGNNTGRLIYGAANTTISGTSPIGISLPDLTISKDLTTVGPIDAGDTIAFAITIANPVAPASRATAFDLALSDVLPAGLTAMTINSVSTTGGLVLTTANFTVTGGNALSLTAPIDLALGQSFTVNIGATVQNSVQAGQTIVNNASVTYTTLPGVVAGERSTTESDPANVVIASNSATKTLFDTSQPGSTGNNLLIGEVATFRIATTLSEGVTNNLVITDLLPAGLVFVSGSVVSIGANISGSALTAGATVASPVFNFGNVTDLANNNAQTAADQIVVEVLARAANVVGNVTGTVLANGATVASSTGTITAPVVNTVIQVPDLVIAKDNVTVGAVDAGDTVTFTINVTHDPASPVPAYDLAIADTLPAGLTNLALTNVAATGVAVTAANFSVAGNALTTTIPFTLALGESFTLTITGQLAASVVGGSTLNNTASVTYSTLPGASANERSFTENDPASVTTAATQSLTKTIAATSIPGTDISQYRPLITDLAIGETATFEIIATFNEGTTNNVVIVDRLPIANGVMQFAATPVSVYIGGVLVALPGGSITFSDLFGGDGINDTITINVGTIVLAGDNIAANNNVRIVYDALLPNLPGNIAGDQLNSQATLTSAIPGTLTAAVDMDVVEPDLTIAKDNITVGAVDAGDTVTFTIAVAHGGGSTVTAYDLAISDTLPAGLTNLALTNVAPVGVAITTANFSVAGNALTTTTPFDLALGQSFTLTVTGQVAGNVVGGSILTNNASVGYTTAPGANPNERTTTRSDPATVTTAATQSLTKTISATTLPGTDIAQYRAGVTDLAIGETATFEIIATFNEGVTNNVVIVDRLPIANGVMQFSATPPSVYIGGVLVALPGGSITYSDLFGGDGINDTITINVGTVTLPGDNIAANNNVRIVYDALLLNLPANIAGDQLNSLATLTSAIPGAPTASVDMDVVEPVLQIAKDAVAPLVQSGTAASYTIAVSHTGASTSTAYDLDLGDILPAGLTGLQVTSVTTGGGLVLTTAAFSTAGNTLNFVTPLDLALGQSFTVTISAIATGPAATVLTNTASVDYSSFDGVSANERAGSVNDTAAVTLTVAPPPPPPPPLPPTTPTASQSFTKAVVATSVAVTGDAQYRAGVPDLAIGETATFELTGTFTAANVANLVITDQLPLAGGTMRFAGTPILFIGGVATAFPAGSISYADSNGDGITDRVVFALGDVTLPTGDLTVRIRYDALLPDLPGNAAGDQLTSPATLTSALGGPLPASVDLDVVAPDLTIAKDVVGPGTLLPGGTATFTIAVAHSGASTANAYDLALADILPAGLTDLAVTGVATGGGLVLSTANFTTAGNMLGLTSPVDLLLGQSFVVTLTGRATAPAGTALVNVASVTFSTLDGDFPTIERSTTLTDPATVTIAPPPGGFALDKAIIATGSPDTGTAQITPGAPDLSIGETVTFTLTITVPPGTNPLVLTDRLSDALGTLQLVGTPVVTAGTGVTLGGIVLTQPDLDGDGSPDLRFDLGIVTAPAGGFITITYTARVPDVPGNAAGDTLLLPAVLTTPTGTLTDSERVDIVEPRLAIVKTVAGANFDAGDIVSYTVRLTNSGTGPAFNVVLSDVLPGGLGYVAGSAGLAVGSVSSAIASPAAATVGRLLPGESATLTYQALIGASAVTGTTLTNSVTATFDVAGGIRPGSVTAAAGLIFGVQALTKTITATGSPETGIAQVRPTVTDLGIGETATFELRVDLSEGVTRGVVVTDTLTTPAGVLTLTGTPQIVLGGIVTTLPGTVQTIDTNGDGVPDQLRFTLGDVTLPANNNPADNFLTIRYTAIVPNVGQNVSGDQLDLPATLTSLLGTVGATASVDIVEPVLVLTKVIAPDQLANGADTVYLLTLTHAANSLSTATAITIQDLLPAGQQLSGTPTIVQGPAGASVNGTTISVPRLAIGETITIRLTTSFDPATATDFNFINRATVVYGGVSFTTGSRQGMGGAAAPAILLGGPIQAPGTSQMFERPGTIGNFFERQYRPIFPQIDPIYSGQSDPGSTVTLGLTGPNGLTTGYGSALVDAGGNWIITMPSSTVNELLERSRLDDYYGSSRLFTAPSGSIFNNRDLFGFEREDQQLSVGSTPSFDPQLGRLTTSGGSEGLGAGFIPTWRSQTFTLEPSLDISGVFQRRAEAAVEGLYDYLAAPEAAGLNRFNTAYLSAGLN